jgi:hypothetical protein
VANVLLFHAGSFGSIYIDAVYGTVMGYLLSSGAVKRSSFLMGGRLLLQRDRGKPLGKEEGKWEEYLRIVLFVGLVTLLCLGHDKGWIAGLVNALFMGAVSVPLSVYLRRRVQARSYTTLLGGGDIKLRGMPIPIVHIKNGMVVGICCGLTSVITIVVSLNASSTGFLFLLVLGLRDSLRNALLGTLLSLLLANNNGIIHRAEIIAWSWKNFWRSFKDPGKLINSLLIGSVAVLTFGAKQSLQGNVGGSVGVGVETGLLIVIGFYLVSALLQGVSNNNLDNNHRVRPNEGIRRSFYHGLLGGAIGTFIMAFFTIITSALSSVVSYSVPGLSQSGQFNFMQFLDGLREGLMRGLNAGFMNVISIGLMGGLLVGLLLGGLAFLQHTVLRFVLWRTNVFPWDIPRFLDAAVSCVLLHKVGGGYTFIHRLLLEYFASLDKGKLLDR